jgi:hypothetical protein
MPNAIFNAKPNVSHVYESKSRHAFVIPLCFCRGLALRVRLDVVSDLVNEIDNHVVFLNADPIKVFPHGEREVIFALSAGLTTTNHGGRVDTNPSRL